MTLYKDLVSGLMDSNFDSAGVLPRAPTMVIDFKLLSGYDVGLHLTPTYKRRHPSAGGPGLLLAKRR